MIVGERKPLKEVLELLSPHRKVLVVGCGACVTVCLAGGEREARELALLLRLKGFETEATSVERQCEREFLVPLRESIRTFSAVLSLACGVGVQVVSDTVPEVPVFPGLNTSFMGAPLAVGVFEERCIGCGECIVHRFGNICPVARCAKSLLNGPCGGSRGGKCEVRPERDCAWQLIYERMRALGRVEELFAIQPPKNWAPSRFGAQRRVVREDVRQ
ncbi:MAG: methylenetetrahydrofolate reductase C-terminal domain-containing protein [Candidatus Caldatribacterium sp.]|uniref:methylenetetrahydrofolate reductase C-terminal domain-containing protein n=1 Tax=Candidatus Caldatribacterium sp. TaxID=2282143 RepID=UPI0029952447|nr:methylenetetrahydrofolate reductase C-terminal domain-containing protein [Candidatus Caldatribacterium sp.]MCX7731486.1 methylenetetrahydrofolate reductase C-terminal domain-containing protein [Candidatus Caldatribacterium sp.]MDW8081675.1 methylenetetrahydrofolate reductase C-terminal domain-containing protein [Candidatus Calescibacterium sp.]